MVLIVALSYTKGNWSIDRLRGGDLRGNRRLSQVSASPRLSIRRVLRPRLDRRFRPLRSVDVVPVHTKTETPAINIISGLNSKAFGLPVYASPEGLLAPDATLGSGGGSTFPGRLVLQGTQGEAFDTKASFVLSRTSWRKVHQYFLAHCAAKGQKYLHNFFQWFSRVDNLIFT